MPADQTALINALILLCTALALFFGHHLPWHIVPGLIDETKQLRRVPSYVYGVGCIIAGFALWVTFNHIDPTAVTALIALSAAAGIGTMLPRGLFLLNDVIATLRESKSNHGETK
jgi:hypothetical protein